MAEIDLRAMQQRIEELGARIETLRKRVKIGDAAIEAARLQQLGELERRHGALSNALAAAHGEAGSARAERHAVAHKLANDLDSALKNFTDWVDAENHPGAPPPGGFSP